MSTEDVRYVQSRNNFPASSSSARQQKSTEPSTTTYDWFAFFLECGVDHNVCSRYAMNFERDQMDESVLPDITTENLRTLGLKEGDILRVMKYLDTKFHRKRTGRSVSFGGAHVLGKDEDGDDDNDDKIRQIRSDEEYARKLTDEGHYSSMVPRDTLADVIQQRPPQQPNREPLFTSASGALKNNTRRGRPTSTLSPPDDNISPEKLRRPSASPSKPNDEGAWSVKPQTSPQAPVPAEPAKSTPNVFSDLQGLSTASLRPPMTSQPPAMSSLVAQQTLGPPQLPSAHAMNHYLQQPPRSQSVPPQQQQFQPTSLSPPAPQPIQPNLTGYQAANITGQPSLNDQLSRLAINGTGPSYPGVNGMMPQNTGSIPQQMQYTGSMTIPQLQPFATGYQPPRQMSYHYPPTFAQQSQFQPPRSISMSLPPPLAPQNTGVPMQMYQQHQHQQAAPFLSANKTGPAMYPRQPSPLNPQPSQFTQNIPPQFPGQQQPSYAQLNFQQSYPSPQPQQNGGIQPQQTGSAPFKPVSFGKQPAPLVPSRTGRRANLASASKTSSKSKIIKSNICSARESIRFLKSNLYTFWAMSIHLSIYIAGI